ncbi:MAG: hypothetical protein NVS1B7_5490 [Candidatus Saccharimonadales bacterium]
MPALISCIDDNLFTNVDFLRVPILTDVVGRVTSDLFPRFTLLTNLVSGKTVFAKTLLALLFTLLGMRFLVLVDEDFFVAMRQL